MGELLEPRTSGPPAPSSHGLTGSLRDLWEALLDSDFLVEGVSQELLDSARELLHRKLTMAGSKNETRHRLEDMLTQRLDTVLAGLCAQGSIPPAQPSEAMVGALVSVSFLADFAVALDRAMLEHSVPPEISFAGRADFISVEEVLQLLGGGTHRGRLTLEKADNRLDVYLDSGAIAFLDPHRMIRRVLLRPDGLAYREITVEMLTRAERIHASEGQPILLTLHAEGFLRDTELADALSQIGREVLLDFLREQSDTSYAYCRLDQLPEFAVKHNLGQGITPLLLDGNKRLDEWRGMCSVFPDADADLQPVENMIVRIGSMDLNVIEIRMLALISGGMSARKLATSIGLPLQQVYQHLVRFAKEGVLVPPGGEEALEQLTMSLGEEPDVAEEPEFEAAEHIGVASALERVLGGGGGVGAGKGVGQAPRTRNRRTRWLRASEHKPT